MFPSMTQKDINTLKNKFYRQLANTFSEILYSNTYPKNIKNRMSFIGFESMNQELENGSSIILSGGHFYNWEWIGIALGAATPHPVFGIYKPLSNKYFEEHFRSIRKSLSVHLLTMRETPLTIRKRNKENLQTIYAFASDQSPTSTKRCLWIDFFNRPTAFYPSIDLFAKKYDLSVYYLDIQCHRRGYYEATAKKITQVEGSWTTAFAKEIENSIKKRPESWLWSHNRWKHVYNPKTS